MSDAPPDASSSQTDRDACPQQVHEQPKKLPHATRAAAALRAVRRVISRLLTRWHPRDRITDYRRNTETPVLGREFMQRRGESAPQEDKLPLTPETAPEPQSSSSSSSSSEPEKENEKEEDQAAPPFDATPEPPTSAPAALRPARPPYALPAEEADPRLPTYLIPVTIAIIALVMFLLNSVKFGQLRQSQSLVDKAEEAIAQKDWPAALGAIQNVEESARTRPGFLRVLADYLIGTYPTPEAPGDTESPNNPELLGDTLQKLKPSSLFRPVDHLWLCRAWLASNHLDRARNALEDIPAPLATGLEATRLKIELLKKEGQKLEAEQIQDSLSKFFSADPAVAVAQAIKDWNSPFPEVWQQARTRLWELARGKDAPALSAIRYLSLQAGHSRAELDVLLQLATDHPAAQAAERLQVLSQLLHLEPEKREQLIQAEVERYHAAAPTVLAQLSSWLSREKEQGRIHQLIPESRWKEYPVLIPLVVQALVDQARWQDLLSMLKEVEIKKQFSRARLMNWRALALRHLHPEDAIHPHDILDEAIQQGNVEQSELALKTSAFLAEQWQMADLALQAYQVLAQPGAQEEADYLEKCSEMAGILKDTRALTEVAVRLAALQPNSTLAAHRATYLRLLRGEMLETAIDTRSPTAASSSSDSATWLLTALQAWRLSDPSATRAALQHVTSIQGLSPGERAVFAGLLAKTASTARAFQIAETIHPELLLPEETVFLQQAL